MEQRPSTLFDPYADAPRGEGYLSAAGNLAVLGSEALEPVPGRRYTSREGAIAVDTFAVRAGAWPHPIFRVVRVEGREHRDPHDRCGALIVAEALPAWLVFGPHGARVARFLDRLDDLDADTIEAIGLDAAYRPRPALPAPVTTREAEAEAHAAAETGHVLLALADRVRPTACRITWPDGGLALADRRWLAFEALAREAAIRLVRGERGAGVWGGVLPVVASH